MVMYTKKPNHIFKYLNMGCSCQKKESEEIMLEFENKNNEEIEEEKLSPRSLEAKYLVIIKSIKTISPLISVIKNLI